MEIKLNVSAETEGTDSPWWMIVDPKQMMKPIPSEVAMGMITVSTTGLYETDSAARAEILDLLQRGCCRPASAG